MRLKDRLIDLCLMMVADTMADLSGIVEAVRAQAECPTTRDSRFAAGRDVRTCRTHGGNGKPMGVRRLSSTGRSPMATSGLMNPPEHGRREGRPRRPR
jgi:hypothetical protein